MNNKTSTLARIATITGLALGAFALSAVAGNWTAPSTTPPTCPSGQSGCDAPINVGASNQAKVGTLSIGTSIPSAWKLDVEGGGYLQALVVGTNIPKTFQYLDGNQGDNKVLTSYANGDASWKAPSGGSTGPATGSVGGGCSGAWGSNDWSSSSFFIISDHWGNASVSNVRIPNKMIDICICPTGYGTPNAYGNMAQAIQPSGASSPYNVAATVSLCLKN